MPPKRKRTGIEEEERTSLTYAGEIQWLRWLTHKSEEQVPYVDIEEDGANQKLLTAACKLVYILYHDIETHDCLNSLLRSLNNGASALNSGSVKAAKVQQSGWKGQIINKFFIPHVKELKRKWEVAHPYASFASLPEPDRIKQWMDAYDADPVAMVAVMLKPIVKVLDLKSIFRTDLVGEDRSRMRAIQAMLRQKYWFGCACSYKYSVEAMKKGKTLEDWAKYAKIEHTARSIVPMETLPVSAEFIAIGPSAKKAKASTSVAIDSEKQSLGLTSDTPSQSAPDSVPFPAEEEQISVEESYTKPHSRSMSRTTSVSDSLPAPDTKIIDMEGHGAILQEQLASPSPSTISTSTSSQGSKKPMSIANFLGTADPAVPRSTTPSEARSSSAAVDDDLL
ncbi:hypothetical protein BU23DRAFT_595635 [Bimuria novae-zelandiae CBS 107.79]|uniref:Uncharacterized protein n=1 Tax=Bimuria novae-zelandiae CBS 107.79 TaxID=1447943 RepID=A0A6A5VZ81_9PLEO|nr:hypothetical protein BU23DRAFT_595635 [Bimuria novae-zelandiae CBS 107.79]